MSYNNLEALTNPDVSFAGLGAVAQMRTLKAIMDQPVEANKNAGIRMLVNKIQSDKATGGVKTSRDNFKERMGLLPENIQTALIEKRAQLSDAILYWNKVCGAVSTKDLIASADTKAAGVTNVDQSKLPSGQWFLLNEIWLLSGVNATLSTTAFGAIADAIANGELEIKVDGKPIMNPISCQAFKRGSAEKVGRYVLDNPKLIEPQKEMRAFLSTSEAMAANTNVQLVFVGSQIITF